jgi:hypothetical protein
MTSQTGKNRQGWRRAVTGGLALSAVAAGAIAGIGAPTALADPATPTPATPSPTDAPPAPAMTADQALAIVDKDYDTGEGGGQISNLIHTALQLRAQGFKPSNANKDAIAAALDQRPNQEPLIAALKATISYQRKLQARQQNAKAPQQGIDMGGGQYPPGQGPPGQAPNGLPPGVGGNPNPGGINIPIPIG